MWASPITARNAPWAPPANPSSPSRVFPSVFELPRVPVRRSFAVVRAGATLLQGRDCGRRDGGLKQLWRPEAAADCLREAPDILGMPYMVPCVLDFVYRHIGEKPRATPQWCWPQVAVGELFRAGRVRPRLMGYASTTVGPTAGVVGEASADAAEDRHVVAEAVTCRLCRGQASPLTRLARWAHGHSLGLSGHR